MWEALPEAAAGQAFSPWQGGIDMQGVFDTDGESRWQPMGSNLELPLAPCLGGLRQAAKVAGIVPSTYSGL